MTRRTRTMGLVLVVFGAALCLPVGFAAQRGVGPAAPPTNAANPTGTGAISGVVVDALTGRPVANAVVMLGGGRAATNRQLTDGRGRFVMRDLTPAAGYVVNATKPGYFDGRFTVKGGAAARPIALADGQWVNDVRIELQRHASISGTVRDERGEPLVGLTVRSLTRIRIAGREQLVASAMARTDDRGAYRIGGLSDGTYVVLVPSVQNAVPADTPVADSASPEARKLPVYTEDVPSLVPDSGQVLVVGRYANPPPPAPGEPLLAYVTTFYPNGRVLAEAAPITIRPGEDRAGVDVQLYAVPVWRVSGSVSGSAGSAAGLLLRLVPPGAESLGLGNETATTLVDQSGRFTFLSVPAGRYTLDARRSFMDFRSGSGGLQSPFFSVPGFIGGAMGTGTIPAAPAGTQYTYVGSGGDASSWGREQVDVDNHDVTGVVLSMRRALTISGRVEFETATTPTPAPTTGRAGGAPTFLRMEPTGGQTWLGMPSATADRANQTFSIPGLLAGQYFLRSPSISIIKSITWDGRDYTYRPFDTTGGVDITGVVVTLTSRIATLSGRVSPFNPDGGAVVVLFPVEQEQWADYGLQPIRVRSVATAGDGTFRVTAPAGQYYAVAVDALHASAWHDPAFLETAVRVATPVTLELGETRTLELKVSDVK